jgi:hypothetical protein
MMSPVRLIVRRYGRENAVPMLMGAFFELNYDCTAKRSN